LATEAAAEARAAGQAAAGRLFEAALARDPTYGAAWNNWGFVQEAAGDWQAAEQCYRRAVSLNPSKHYSAHTNLAKLLHLHGRQLSASAYDQQSSSNHKDRNGGDDRGMGSGSVGRSGVRDGDGWGGVQGGSSRGDGNGDGGPPWDDATAAEVEAHYRQAVAIFPTYGTGLYNLATWLHTKHGSGGGGYGGRTARAKPAGWFNEVASLYRRAIVAAPHLPEPYFNLASLLHQGASNAQHAAGGGGGSSSRSSRAAAGAALGEAKQLLQFAVATFPAYAKPRELLPVVESAWRDLQH
jgi:tetratricopeptide (TPR) repeat protein